MPAPAFAQRTRHVAGRVIDPSGEVVRCNRNGDVNHRFLHPHPDTIGPLRAAPLVAERWRHHRVTGFSSVASWSSQCALPRRLDIRLELGSLAETLLRAPSGFLLRDRQLFYHPHLSAGQIEQLPVMGRNFRSSPMLTPGVLPAFGHVEPGSRVQCATASGRCPEQLHPRWRRQQLAHHGDAGSQGAGASSPTSSASSSFF